MVVYNCYIYNKSGECIFFRDWTEINIRTSGRLTGNTPTSPTNNTIEKSKSKKDLVKLEGDMKLMYGLMFSLKAFVKGIAPKDNENFRSFNTSTYKLHFYEAPTGIKFIFLTDPNSPELDDRLVDMYTKIFVPYVMSNPLYTPFGKIDCHLFTDNLDKYAYQYMQ